MGIGCAETAQTAAVAVAALAAKTIRGSAFGLLAPVQALGNLTASTVAGLLHTVASPMVEFVFVAAWMLVALFVLTWAAQHPVS